MNNGAHAIEAPLPCMLDYDLPSFDLCRAEFSGIATSLSTLFVMTGPVRPFGWESLDVRGMLAVLSCPRARSRCVDHARVFVRCP